MTKFRREHDSVGEMDILENAYYGANAKRAEENFPITGLKAWMLWLKLKRLQLLKMKN